MNSLAGSAFVETRAYRQFAEFCASCERSKYIGVCYGPPGVGKTLSAKKYARWDNVAESKFYLNRYPSRIEIAQESTVLFYTPQVLPTPSQIRQTIENARSRLRDVNVAAIRKQLQPAIDKIENKLEALRVATLHKGRWLSSDDESPEYAKLKKQSYELKKRLDIKCYQVKDPTTLIIVDEANRLKETGLEQIRDIYDRGEIGVVLIGMNGLEKSLARYPQLYSRVGNVYHYQAFPQDDLRKLLAQSWRPEGVSLPSKGLIDEEVIAAIWRATQGNFRTLHRLLTEMGRLVELNDLSQVTAELVETACEGLVLGDD